MAEAHERANAEYKAGVTFFNREDYASAEPRFRAALAIAPIFPEPNYALGQVRPCQPSPPPSAPSPVAPAEYSPLSSVWRQLLLRTQRHAEARHHLDAAASLVEASKAAAARADLTSRENLGRLELCHPTRAPLPRLSPSFGLLSFMRPRGRLRGAHVQRIESLRKVTFDPQSSSTHAGAYATMHKIAIALLECHDLVAAMAASDSAQDQHNALIHHKSFLDTESAFVALLKAPNDANLWWQLGLHAFNSRRDHYSASLAIEQAMKLAPRMTRYAYYLLYHAWGQVR